MSAPSKIERNVKLNIAQRINAAMAEVDYIQKERKQGMQYTIVSHDAVTAKVRPILQGHGVVYYPRDMAVNQSGNRTEAVFNVRFENIDDRTDFIDVATFGYGVDPQDKGPGKAMSYGVKYALLKVLGLETGDDPDTVQDERANHRPEPVGPAMATDAQCALIMTLAPVAGKTIQTIVEAYNVSAIDELTEPKAAALVKRLEADAKANTTLKADTDILEDSIPY